MGSGKSATGKILAQKLDFLFIDVDKIIELDQGLQISDIFERYGEKYFRNIETEIITKIYQNSCCIFACGGGVVLKDTNMETIAANSTTVYLQVSPENAFNRLKDCNDRPLLKVENIKNTISGLILNRDIFYRKYADLIINTDLKDPEAVSEEILLKLNVPCSKII